MMMAPPLARPPPTRYPLWKFEGCILGGPRNAPVGMPSSARDPSLSVFFFFSLSSFLFFCFLFCWTFSALTVSPQCPPHVFPFSRHFSSHRSCVLYRFSLADPGP